MRWRLLHDGPTTGAWNMAVDEAMLLSAVREDIPASLRFYGWRPPCISLGRFQNCDFLGNAPASAFDVVRRPTGGRAVLHQHEVTYSAVLQERILPAGSTSVVGAYRWLSSGLLAGLAVLGVKAELSRAAPARQERQKANCFASASYCDFIADDRKLVGAAQCRKKGAILQHGSILLRVDAQAWGLALGEPPFGMTSLHDLGLEAGVSEVCQALCLGVAHQLGADLVEEPLCPSEMRLAEHLHREKYGSDQWTRTGRTRDQVNVSG